MTVWSAIVVAKGMWQDFTRVALESLVATTLGEEWDLVYVDNGTPPGEASWQLASEVLPDLGFRAVKMLRFGGAGVCLSRAWNEGISAATGMRILVCNNDLRFLKAGWLPQFDAALDDPKCGAVGMTAMSWRGTAFLQGSLFAFQREVYNLVGPFDERYPFTCEDVDFSHRLQDAGYFVRMVEPPLLGEYVFHHEGATRNYYKDDLVNYQRLAHISRIEYCYKFDYPSISIHD